MFWGRNEAPREYSAPRRRPSLSFQRRGPKVLRLESTGLGSNSQLAAMVKTLRGSWRTRLPRGDGDPGGRAERSLGEPSGLRGGSVPAPGARFRPGPAPCSLPRRVLPGTFRGGPRAPAVLRRPARGRHGSGARPAPLSSPGCGPSGGDVPEPRGGRPSSATFPGGADVNSCLPAGKEAAGLRPSPGEAGRLAGGPGRSGERGPEWLASSADPGRAAAPCGPPPGRGWRSPPGSHRWRRRWAAAPRSTWGPGGGGLASPWEEGPGAGRGRPRRPAGRAGAGARGEPGPTWNESEITLFNYTFPRPPSAIGAF